MHPQPTRTQAPEPEIESPMLEHEMEDTAEDATAHGLASNVPLGTGKVNDNDLSIDEYRALYEAYKNPPTVKEETPPPSPFPWINSEFVGAGWKKR